MFAYLWLIVALPLAGFVVLILGGGRLPGRTSALVGAGSVVFGALLTLALAAQYFFAPLAGHTYVQDIATWISAGAFTASFSLRLDALSLVMMLVITVVASLILIYSCEFMRGDEQYARFFAFMDLFVGSMLILVLADDLVFLLLGWEGVGLCSYLLIGFWYKDSDNVRAARKAFVVTRIGDAAFLVGLFLLFNAAGTLRIQDVQNFAAQNWGPGTALPTAAAALLLAGAIGKSAQLPLQVWLPDAMAGPTPVSALIHAATMVTAGVYLIARMHGLFELAPTVLHIVAIIGAATLLMAGFAALAQRDIKRVLAYSTISQIGYMFMALGVGAWVAAIFHFAVHAFMKSLLFLSAGVIIKALEHEQDLFKMGGLRRSLKGTFAAFLVGASSLAAVPVVTAGFFSKDLILLDDWTSPTGGHWLWLCGLVGAFLTALYIFRVVFLAFFGDLKREPNVRPGLLMMAPVAVLSVLSIAVGWLQVPSVLGQVELFSRLLGSVLPGTQELPIGMRTEGVLELVASGAALSGIFIAWTLFLWKPHYVRDLLRTPAGASTQRFLQSGFGFDRLYNVLVIRPFVVLTQANRNDVLLVYNAAIQRTVELAHYLLRFTQTGNARWYAASATAGAIVIIAIGVVS